jgi:hypothetical protein
VKTVGCVRVIRAQTLPRADTVGALVDAIVLSRRLASSEHTRHWRVAYAISAGDQSMCHMRIDCRCRLRRREVRPMVSDSIPRLAVASSSICTCAATLSS